MPSEQGFRGEALVSASSRACMGFADAPVRAVPRAGRKLPTVPTATACCMVPLCHGLFLWLPTAHVRVELTRSSARQFFVCAFPAWLEVTMWSAVRKSRAAKEASHMSITQLVLPSGVSIETTDPASLAAILPTLLGVSQPTPTAPSKTVQQSVSSSSTVPTPKAATPKGKGSKTTPKASPKATVVAMDRKAKYTQLVELSKTDPKGAASEARNLGWFQVAEAIERREHRTTQKAAKQPVKKSEKASPVVEVAPPKVEQKKAAKTAKRSAKKAAASQDTVARATLKRDVADLTPSVELEARKVTAKAAKPPVRKCDVAEYVQAVIAEGDDAILAAQEVLRDEVKAGIAEGRKYAAEAAMLAAVAIQRWLDAATAPATQEVA